MRFNYARAIQLFFIVLAGETVFMLPFLIPRIYRPLMLEVWGISNTNLGVAFSAYGISAMLSYLLGGPLADRYPPRILLCASLVLTAFGGFYLVHRPSVLNLVITYGFFGVSTIFLMWSAMIRATHVAAGEHQRSLAMGILDGGRGLTAAAFGSFLTAVITLAKTDLAGDLDQIYYLTSGFTLLVALGVWICLRDFHGGRNHALRWTFREALLSLANKQIWLLSLVVLGSYCGYKGIDNYVIYLVDVHQVEVASASAFTTAALWLRPITAVAVGFWADKRHRQNGKARFLILTSLLFLGGLAQLLLAFTGAVSFYYCFTVILLSAAFTYALRAIYFSVFGDLRILPYLLGTSAGIVSFVGFLPDVFFGFITGLLIDAFPGELGFQFAFLFTAACLFLGAVAGYFLFRGCQPPANA